MGNLLPKFIYFKKGDHNESKNEHYEYCCNNNLPFVSVETSGKKYWKIVYDTFTIKKFERFYAIKYDDYIQPFYKDYCEKVKLPLNKSSLFDNFSFIVYKEDAPDIAEKLFDLLILLSKRDQELFDENPIEVNEQGFNSEGFHISYYDDLKEMSDDDLINEFRSIKSGNPLMLRTLELIKNELTKRNITSDKFMR